MVVPMWAVDKEQLRMTNNLCITSTVTFNHSSALNSSYIIITIWSQQQSHSITNLHSIAPISSSLSVSQQQSHSITHLHLTVPISSSIIICITTTVIFYHSSSLNSAYIIIITCRIRVWFPLDHFWSCIRRKLCFMWSVSYEQSYSISQLHSTAPIS